MTQSGLFHIFYVILDAPYDCVGVVTIATQWHHINPWKLSFQIKSRSLNHLDSLNSIEKVSSRHRCCKIIIIGTVCREWGSFHLTVIISSTLIQLKGLSFHCLIKLLFEEGFNISVSLQIGELPGLIIPLRI